jgi:outer membrane receptor protein involved in Fe transport
MTTPLESLRRPSLRTVVATVSLAATCLSPLPGHAQTAPARAAVEDEPVVLSPFVVNTNKDIGYMANSTLSGTRTNTDIKDIGNPIDIFTSELMKDLAIQDIQDLTAFANGVEPNAAGDFNSDGQEREVWNYNYMQIRGFKTGALTRNFMDLNAQFEAYNSERVEFSKGPNAILSGSGNPGGTVNYTTKVPRLHRNAYEFSHTTDDLGSQRATVDVDTVLVKDKLGLRLNAMAEDQEFYRSPGYERQFAWHLVGQYRPTPNTTITLGHENRDSNRATPRGIFANDRVTLWRNAGAPLVTAVPSNNNVIIAGNTTPQTAASIGAATLNADNWVLDSDGIVRNTRSTARGNIVAINGANLDTVSSGLDFPQDIWIGGPNGINDSDWDITEANLTQRLTDDLYVDLSYGHTKNIVMQGNSVSRELYVDVNDFGANTHPGELYAETRPFWINRGIYVDHLRATVSYNFDATTFNKWLGTHRLAGAYEYNEREEWQNNGRLTLTATPAGPINPASYSGGYQNAALAFNIRDYLNPAAGQYTARDLRSLYYSDGVNQNGYVAEFLRREGYATTHVETAQDSMLGVLQSRWFSDRLITTIGLRKDKREELRAPFVLSSEGQWVPVQLVDGAPSGEDHPRYAAFTTPPIKDEGISRNYGAVFHATNWLSFTFNHATNFSPRVESNDMYGNFLAASTGESTDYGLRLNLFQDKLSVSLVRYETSELGSATNGNSINSPFNDLVEIEDILVEHGIIASSPLVGVFTTADRTAKGEELTIIGNPTDNWTFRLAASRLDNRQRNLAPDVSAYYEEHLPFYKQQDPNLTLAGSTDTLAKRITEAETAYSFMKTREGVQVFPASEYNVRFTGKYTFRDSILKGFSAGGNVRWASAPVIGYYRTAQNTFDATRFNKGDDPIYTDLFFTYERRLARGIHWRVQLNISNVFDRADPLPVGSRNTADAADYTWSPYRYRPVDGRIFTLTNTFSF